MVDDKYDICAVASSLFVDFLKLAYLPRGDKIQVAHQMPGAVDHWENTKLKCSRISVSKKIAKFRCSENILFYSIVSCFILLSGQFTLCHVLYYYPGLRCRILLVCTVLCWR